MAFDYRVEVQGGLELKALLYGAVPSEMRGALRSGIARASRVVARTAKGTAPRDTALLRRSEGSKVKVFKNGGIVGIVGARSGHKQLAYSHKKRRLEFRDPRKYSHLVEHGHEIKNQYGSYGFVVGNPYLERASKISRSSARAALIAGARGYIARASWRKFKRAFWK